MERAGHVTNLTPKGGENSFIPRKKTDPLQVVFLLSRLQLLRKSYALPSCSLGLTLLSFQEQMSSDVSRET